MMTDNLIFGGPVLLSDLDITVAAGGYMENQPGDGSGGPTGAEMHLEALYANYSSPTTGGDAWTSYHQNGAMFYDSDDNGYYDILQRVDDYGVWHYNTETGDWNRKPFSENKDADNKSP